MLLVRHLALVTSVSLLEAVSWRTARSALTLTSGSPGKGFSRRKAQRVTPVDIGLWMRVSSQAGVSGDQQETRPALVPKRNVAARGPAVLDKPATLPEDVCPTPGGVQFVGSRHHTCFPDPGSPLELVIISPRDCF